MSSKNPRWLASVKYLKNYIYIFIYPIQGSSGQILIDNGYPEDVLVSCIKEKLANISSEKRFGPEKCPVYLKLPWIGKVSSKI